jgi:DnaJ family protein A protein 2
MAILPLDAFRPLYGPTEPIIVFVLLLCFLSVVIDMLVGRNSRHTCKRFFSSSAYYDLLKLPKTASDDEVKKAYKKAALEHHPDRGGDPEKFKEISHAYSVLSDPSKRQIYDQFGESGLENGGGAGPSSGGSGYEDPMDIFSQVFGGASRRRQGGLVRGRDALYNLELTLEEIAQGANRTIAYNRDVGCGNCGGRGATKIDPCKRCGGSGVVLTRQNIGFLVHMQTACPDCGGEGFRVPKDGHCRPCNGSGIVGQKEVFNVNIPKGAPTGYQVRFTGKADQLPGHTAGDVVVQVKIKPHPVFTRMGGADLVMKKEISLADALSGFTFDVKTVLGNRRKISCTNVVSPQDVWVARGEGLPRFDGSTRGDLFVSFTVKFPMKIEDISEPDRERVMSAFNSEKKSGGGICDILKALKPGEEVCKLERVDSNETRRKVSETLNPTSSNNERRHQHRTGGGVDPQQCQQQ